MAAGRERYWLCLGVSSIFASPRIGARRPPHGDNPERSPEVSVDPCPSSHRVTIADTGEAYACNSAETVLVGLARLGKRGIPVGCRGGGCGVCKVEVVSGQYRKRVMSRTHVNADDEACHRVLACCIYPSSDVVVRAIGAMQKSLNRGSNAAAPAAAAPPEAAKT